MIKLQKIKCTMTICHPHPCTIRYRAGSILSLQGRGLRETSKAFENKIKLLAMTESPSSLSSPSRGEDICAVVRDTTKGNRKGCPYIINPTSYIVHPIASRNIMNNYK